MNPLVQENVSQTTFFYIINSEDTKIKDLKLYKERQYVIARSTFIYLFFDS